MNTCTFWFLDSKLKCNFLRIKTLTSHKKTNKELKFSFSQFQAWIIVVPLSVHVVISFITKIKSLTTSTQNLSWIL
jgi:hypothetical protein